MDRFFSWTDVDSRPWDYQAEECSLRAAVDRFNHRRYQKELPNQAQSMQQSQEKSDTSQVFGQDVIIISSDLLCHATVWIICFLFWSWKNRFFASRHKIFWPLFWALKNVEVPKMKQKRWILLRKTWILLQKTWILLYKVWSLPHKTWIFLHKTWIFLHKTWIFFIKREFCLWWNMNFTS